VTQPLRDEHPELVPRLEMLPTTAEAVGAEPPPQLLQRVDEAYQFLAGHLIPHARAEDRALYPVIARVMGAAEATATMSRDHVEVVRLTEELAGIRASMAAGRAGEAELRDVQRVLYGLYALVRHHFAKEEEIYLPLLDARLRVSEAAAMREATEKAATEARATAL